MPTSIRRAKLFWMTLGFLIFILVPYLIAYQAASDQYVFGGFLINPIDGNSYLAKMYQGWQGHWQYTMHYTATVQEGGYVFLFYIFLGHLAKFLGLSLVLTFHLARIVGALAMTLSIYYFFAKLEMDPRSRDLGLGLAIFGSGIGWIGVLLGFFSSDLWVAEAYPFLSAYANPHFPISLALMLVLLTPDLDGYSLRWGDLFMGLAAVALSIISPFAVIITLIVIAIYGVWEFLDKSKGLSEWGGWKVPTISKRFGIVLLAGTPFLGYYLWLVHTNPVFSNWNAQNITPSPGILDFALSFLPVFVLSMIGIWYVIRQGNILQRVLVIWAVVGVLLSYVPWSLQRRFLTGLFVPLAGLAIIGLIHIFNQDRKRFRLMVVLLFILVVPTNFFVLMTSFYGIQTHDLRIYLRHSEDQAMKWIAANTPEDAVILAAPETGLFIPAHTGRRVLYGHPFESTHAQDMENLVERYFEGKINETDKNQLLVVDYVFLGPREKEFGECPCEVDLPLVHEIEGVEIYQSNRMISGFALER